MAKLALLSLIAILIVSSSYALPSNRVVGGVDATAGQFPHQISLRRNGSHTCGGSIISRNFILTAAHCVGYSDATGAFVAYPASAFTVRAGTNDRLVGGVVANIAEIIIHETYGNFLNDVALLKLKDPLIFSKNIQPIPIASRETPAASPIIISGWGRVKHNGDIPQKLQWNTLTSITRSECKEKINWDSDALICLAHEPNNGACNGDSGGPALYNGEVVGIAGFVYTGCGTAYPDGYAKVYYHRDWIKKNSDL